MTNKILWLSILGLALAKAPNPIESTLSEFSEEERQRSSRSIWPFASSETTTEAPEAYPPLLPDNNEWFVQGETSLPEGIDLNKYPIWKIHKYNGINLHPVNLQPHNYYPPEETIVEAGYPSGPNLPHDFPPNSYLNGYQDFLDSRDYAERQSQTAHGTHSAGYPPATYSSDKENYRTGEDYSSSVTPGLDRFNIQTQEKHETYIPPLPLTDFRSTAVPEAPKVPGYRYGPPNGYRETTNVGHNHQEEIQPAQRQPIGFGEEQSSAISPLEASNGKEPDLSLLDQLSALNSFFPGDETENSESSSPDNEGDNAQQGFFENLFSRFRGTTEAPTPALQVSENDESPKSGGGFLSSLFGQGSGAVQKAESGSSVNTEPSRNAFSSLFNQPKTERPAVILPTTYYLPKTRGSYVAVKIPVTNTAPLLGQTLGTFDDLSNVAFDDLPKVPFRQHEIPDISGPTLDSGYPYHPSYLDVRNSGLAGSTINADYPPTVGYGQPHPDPVGSEFYSTKLQSGYKGSDYHVDQNFPPFSTSSDDAEALDQPRAEYLHSATNDRTNGSPVLPSSQSSYHREEQPERQSPVVGYQNSLSSTSADGFTQSRNNNFNPQSASGGADYRYQNFGTTNSNFRNPIHFGENVVRAQETGAIDNRGREPVSRPELSADFIPVSSYGVPDKRNEKLNFENDNEEEIGQIIGEDNFRANFGVDASRQNFEESSPALNEEDRVPAVQTNPSQSSVLSSISAQNPTTVSQTQRDIERFLPMKEAVDFHQVYNGEIEEFENNRFVENLSSLTSLGASTNSYGSDPFSTASSDVKVITVYPSGISDKVDDGLDVNSNRDAFRSALSSEQLHGLKKPDRVVVRKVIKRRNFFEGNNNSQISNPARQAPIEETDASSIIRSDADLASEIQGGRKFDETDITTGYSKVQHPQHKILQQDNDQSIESVNPELGEGARK